MSCSNGGGGTLTIPSPTHAHHVDFSSAVRTLRRSMSRSPSKLKLAGVAAAQSVRSEQSLEGFAAQLRSSTSSPGRYQSSPFTSPPPPLYGQSSSPCVTPSRSGVKLSVRSTRAKSASRPVSRARTSPKSPLKRVFGSTAESASNQIQIPSSFSGPDPSGQENNNCYELSLAFSPVSPVNQRNYENIKPSRHSMHLDVSGSSKHNVSKLLDVNEVFPSTTVSPLKRPDALMSSDQGSQVSPVAKRRSLHGISSIETDFSVFDQPAAPEASNFEIHDEAIEDYQLMGSLNLFHDLAPPPTPTAMPKRSCSLRKTTLQQRHGERSSWGRRAGEKQLAQLSQDLGTPIGRNWPRRSVDQLFPPDERGSPFGPQAPLPNPSVHPLPRQAHPLSRTITQSSSSSSFDGDSPTHVPVKLSERPRGHLNFSKSLPPGTQRPMHEEEDPVTTPQYKYAKPFQAAFMSTGLVSKLNRHPEMGPVKKPGAKAIIMPDTPCKKQAYPSATYPPHPGSGRRQTRPSVGSPSTPLSPASCSFQASAFGGHNKPGGLFFKSMQNGHSRKSSALSLDGDEFAEPLSGDDFPPTPTRNLFKSATGPQPSTTHVSRPFAVSFPEIGAKSNNQVMASQSELNPISHEAMDCSSSVSPHSLRLEVLSQGDTSPPSPFPLSREVPVLLVQHQTRQKSWESGNALKAPNSEVQLSCKRDAKTGSMSPVSPVDPTGRAIHNVTPQTPRELIMPPDPSGLSISNIQEEKAARAKNDRASLRPPATPTTHSRCFGFGFSSRRVTPENGHGLIDVDSSLTARFDKAEVVGMGEFSKVYRIVKSSLSPRPGQCTPASRLCERVYAVKKIKISSFQSKERDVKLREVEILQALAYSDKVIRYYDHWEQDFHLYIQTEYCAEGALDAFLKQVGNTGRLDDFRIWKILAEITQGLRAVHDAGFMHLDLKPANVFVNAEGYLKIGDFGMAAQSPAPKDIEGEGDREYIAPEILSGRYEKAADVFALGLIIFEIACNVILPDNGPTWQALRNGEMRTLGSHLTSPESANLARDANGVPISRDSGCAFSDDEDLQDLVFGKVDKPIFNFSEPEDTVTHDAGNLFGAQQKRNYLRTPPNFMVDHNDVGSLDSIVAWMIQPDPALRPSAQQLLDFDSVRWVTGRRMAGATVFEGSCGPQLVSTEQPFGICFPEESVDTEMTDV